MNTVFCLTNSLSLPNASDFICGSIGESLMPLLQVALVVWIVLATLGAIVDLAIRRKEPVNSPDTL